MRVKFQPVVMATTVTSCLYFRAGHMARVIEECRRHQRLLNESIEKLNTGVRNAEKGQQGVVTALSRLIILFPSTSINDIYR